MLDRRPAIRRNAGMLPRRRLVALLAVWCGVAGTCLAQSSSPAAVAETPVWAQAFAAFPVVWIVLIFSAIGTVALIGHLGISLSDRQAAPAPLNEAIRHAMDNGNYQEAWEACGHWPAAYLSRVLQPALERIGQGKELAEAALDHRTSQEIRAMTLLTWILPGIGIALPLIAGFFAWCRLGLLFRSDALVTGARDLTLAEGNFALVVAVALGTAITAVIFWLSFRGRVSRTILQANEEGRALLQDLAYEDLEGLRVGRAFDAGTLLGEDAEFRTSGLLRVSRALTTSCPQCNAPINFSHKRCPHCNTALEWS
jgi:biopolymer transport protein ExbB/TolQ